MHQCLICDAEWKQTRPPGPTDRCPACNAALHNCQHCGHLDPERRVCLHPMADQPAALDRPNDCAMFTMVDARDRKPAGTLGAPDVTGCTRDVGSVDARASWDALFRRVTLAESLDPRSHDR